MDLIPAEKGGDDYYLNGGYVRLEDAGKSGATSTDNTGANGTGSDSKSAEGTQNKNKGAKPPRRK